MAELTKERDSIIVAIKAYKDLFETTEQLRTEFKGMI